MQRDQSRQSAFTRSKRKRITTIMPGRCDEQPTNQHENKKIGGASPTKYLCVASCSGTRSGYSLSSCPRSSIEGTITARLGESKQWHDHLSIDHVIRSTPVDIKHVVTRLELQRVLSTARKRHHGMPRPTGSIATS